MRAASTTSTTAASLPAAPLEIFAARCRARASLYASGDIEDLRDAVDRLEEHAERHGLVAAHGQDHVRAIIASAFRPVRAGEVPS